MIKHTLVGLCLFALTLRTAGAQGASAAVFDPAEEFQPIVKLDAGAVNLMAQVFSTPAVAARLLELARESASITRIELVGAEYDRATLKVVVHSFTPGEGEPVPPWHGSFLIRLDRPQDAGWQVVEVTPLTREADDADALRPPISLGS